MAGSVVQSVGNDTNAAGTTLATGAFASSVTINNFILVTLTLDSAEASITISKNSGTATIGAVTQREQKTEVGTSNLTTWFTFQVTATGTLDILATTGSAHSTKGISASEISGVNAYQVSSSATDAGNNPTTTINATVSTAPAFGVMTGCDVQGGTLTVGTGYTSDGTTGTGVQDRCSIQHQSFSTTGSKSGNFANAGFDRNNAALIIFTEGSFGAQNQLAWVTA